LGRRADVSESEIGVEQRDAAPAFLDQRSEALLAHLELVLRAFAFGDVADECGERLLFAGADRVEDDFHWNLRTVRATRSRFESPVRNAFGDRVEQRGKNRGRK